MYMGMGLARRTLLVARVGTRVRVGTAKRKLIVARMGTVAYWMGMVMGIGMVEMVIRSLEGMTMREGMGKLLSKHCCYHAQRSLLYYSLTGWVCRRCY